MDQSLFGNAWDRTSSAQASTWGYGEWPKHGEIINVSHKGILIFLSTNN